MDRCQVYSPEQIDGLVELYLGGADREKLDPILDACVAVYVNDLDEDGQVDFKGKAKAFTRTYDFLATILPYGVPEMDKLSNIINAFNNQFGALFNDPSAVEKRITEVIPPKVSADPAYQNARQNSDRQNARIEHDKALKRVITAMFKDDAQLFKQFPTTTPSAAG